MTTNDDILDLKRPYRKKALQTGYSQSGPSVVSMASEWAFMRPQAVSASLRTLFILSLSIGLLGYFVFNPYGDGDSGSLQQ